MTDFFTTIPYNVVAISSTLEGQPGLQTYSWCVEGQDWNDIINDYVPADEIEPISYYPEGIYFHEFLFHFQNALRGYRIYGSEPVDADIQNINGFVSIAEAFNWALNHNSRYNAGKDYIQPGTGYVWSMKESPRYDDDNRDGGHTEEIPGSFENGNMGLRTYL